MEIIKSWMVWDSSWKMMVLTANGEYFWHTLYLGHKQFVELDEVEAKRILKENL